MKKTLKRIKDFLSGVEKPDDWYGITVTVETKDDVYTYTHSERIDPENIDYFLRFYTKQCIIEILRKMHVDKKIENALKGENI